MGTKWAEFELIVMFDAHVDDLVSVVETSVVGSAIANGSSVLRAALETLPLAVEAIAKEDQRLLATLEQYVMEEECRKVGGTVKVISRPRL